MSFTAVLCEFKKYCLPAAPVTKEILSIQTPMLQSVSTAEAGFYKCVSIGLTDLSYNIQSVELVVKKDWEELWETDKEVRCFTKLM
jgi:hypothetical protein